MSTLTQPAEIYKGYKLHTTKEGNGFMTVATDIWEMPKFCSYSELPTDIDSVTKCKMKIDGNRASLLNQNPLSIKLFSFDVNNPESHIIFPESITNEKEAREYITLLVKNNLSYHPDDAAADCFEQYEWKPEVYTHMDTLMDQIRALKLDPCELFCEIENPEYTSNMKAIAHQFAENLKKELTAEQMADVNQMNSEDYYQDGACASHNYCDANEFMNDAIETVMGRPWTADDMDMADESWAFARQNNFFIN